MAQMMSELVANYNKMAGELGLASVKRFSSTVVGAKRLAALRAQMPKAKPAKADAGTAGSRIGAVSKFAGKTFRATVAANPRRLGSHGWRAMEIVMANPGLTYERFLELGGRNVDLAWDIAHGSVKAGK
jgi:hypothetical protein